MKKLWRNTNVFILLFTIVLSLCGFKSQSRKTVRVGCMDIANFFEIGIDGEPQGYGAEYLDQIAKYANWEYEYVEGTWNQCMEWLKDGEIDLLFPAEYSDERAKYYAFSDSNCCIDFVSLLTNEDNTSLYYEDPKSYENITVGLIKDNILNDTFEEYAKNNSFSYKKKFYNSSNELCQALQNNEVDAIINGNLSVTDGQKLLVKFDYMPAYFITSIENQSLMRELNNALYRINLEDPYFSADLVEKYYSSSLVKGFSREEADYIRQADVLKVVGDPNNYPFEWYDKKEGKFRGIVCDALEIIFEKSGLKYQYQPTNSLSESWDMVKNKQADILSGVFIDKYISKNYNIEATSRYMFKQYMAISRKEDQIFEENNLKVAIKSSFVGTKRFLEKTHPNWTVVKGDTIDDCLNSVLNGDADFALVDTVFFAKFKYTFGK